MNTIKMILGGLVGFTLLVGCAGTDPIVDPSDDDGTGGGSSEVVQAPIVRTTAPVQAPVARKIVTAKAETPVNTEPGTIDVGGGVCGLDAKQACMAKGNACVPGVQIPIDEPIGAHCYDFKACYEDVQSDPEAVQACVDADPEGAQAWADLVECMCACDWAPENFCDGSKYGHPNG